MHLCDVEAMERTLREQAEEEARGNTQEDKATTETWENEPENLSSENGETQFYNKTEHM